MTEPAKIKCDSAISIPQGGNLIVPHRLIERERVNENDRRPIAFVAIFNVSAIYRGLHGVVIADWSQSRVVRKSDPCVKINT